MTAPGKVERRTPTVADKKNDQPEQPAYNIDVRDLPDNQTPEQRATAERAKAQNEEAKAPQIQTEEK